MPELSMLEKIFVFLQYIVPQHLLSRLTGWLADSKIKFLKNFLIHHFINQFGVDMSLAKNPDPQSYENFNAFFTRALKEDIRPIDSRSHTFCSPVDGSISELGNIEHDRLIQAKGFYFDLISLVGGDDALAENFINGNFATIYLSPKDYHRIHMPCSGRLVGTTYVPGKLFSVNNATAKSVPHLFARNERLICEFETDRGSLVIIFVGAMIVAGIETVWGGQVTPLPKIPSSTRFDKKIEFEKGDEIGRFKLGSTVIILSQSGSLNFNDFSHGDAIRMGEAFANYLE